jgi:WD40 repeat protein
MVGQPPGRTFISYSRKDGAEFAAGLRGWLSERNLSVWQDIVALEGGRDWWSQIEEVLKLKAVQHFILVVTPASLASPVVRREIRLARQEGKTACPVRGPGLSDLRKLPRWLGQIYDLDLIEHQTTLVRVLEADSRQKRVPMMAPEPPPDFVPRPKEFDALKQQLLDSKGDAVAGITAALKGAGGYGKTTLAKALAHDPDVQDAFFDGILWAELGEKPERLLLILVDQIELLTGERPGLETINAAAGKLGEALGDRRILLVVDDAWREQDLRPFLQGGSNCVRLVTTRIDSVLPSRSLRQPVDAMQGGEALKLLSAGLSPDEIACERPSLAKLAGRLGEWPQLLKIVNGFLRDRSIRAKESLAVAIIGANKRLDVKGLSVFDPRDESDRAKAVARTIGISLELLSEAERVRFVEFGIFPEDAEIPVGVVARMWATTGGLEEFETEDRLSRLFDLSLLLDLDLGQRFFRLHDTIRQFLRDQAGKGRLVAQHKQLAAALADAANDPDSPTRRYFYLYLPHHVAEADERERLDALLLDPGWLCAKLNATGSPYSLYSDYQQYGVGKAQNLIGQTLRLISGICVRDSRQLPLQLADRLSHFETGGMAAFVEKARALIPKPAIVPRRPSLAPPGAETARLEGHTGSVISLCVLPNGWLASGSDDSTIRLWDVATAAETACLAGHSRWVRALCAVADGRLASGSDDKTIRLWDVTTGAETARLEGHAGIISALCAVADGRLASGSDDKTIRLWDVTTGAETARLEGHAGFIGALCPLADGRLASGSDDDTIRLWDVTTGTETARFEGHSGNVVALCLLMDGRLASGSHDNTIRLWDVTTGAETARLDGHSHAVHSLCVLRDGRLASGSWDDIRIRVPGTGFETTFPEMSSFGGTELCLLSDGRLASGCEDKTIRLWDVTTVAETARPEWLSNEVSACCLLPDGRLALGFSDNTVRLQDVATGVGDRLSGGAFRKSELPLSAAGCEARLGLF